MTTLIASYLIEITLIASTCYPLLPLNFREVKFAVLSSHSWRIFGFAMGFACLCSVSGSGNALSTLWLFAHFATFAGIVSKNSLFDGTTK